MSTATKEPLTRLYLADETAWLDSMAELIARHEFGELDYEHLREYLTDMAIRDRREVWSRMVILILHHLKWNAQPERRKNGWQSTIIEQRRELSRIFKSKVLRNHSEIELADAYAAAVEQAMFETKLAASKFPAKSIYTASEWVALPVPE